MRNLPCKGVQSTSLADRCDSFAFHSEENLTEFQKLYSIADDNPEIHLERGRLIRNIEVNQQVYITLKQQYELNKLATVIKHIPGHGCASQDSHLKMPKVKYEKTYYHNW